MKTGLISSLFKKRESKPEGYAWIGLDFGTATTECVIRIELPGEQDRIAILAFGGHGRTDAAVVLPTAMEVLNNMVVPSFRITGRGRIVEMLKTELIAEIERGLDPAILRRSDGPLAWIVLHLASVLSIARAAIDGWMKDRRLSFYVNVAAPIGADLEDPRDARLRDVFREAAYRALVLSSNWPGRSLTVAKAKCLLANAFATDLPSRDMSPVTVVPEALAAVTSCLHSPSRQAGNYATVDVGGGTTDISFFWYQTGHNDPAHEKKAWYYSVRSTPVGTNDLIAGLCDAPCETRSIIAHERLKQISDPHLSIHVKNLDGFTSGIDRAYKEAFRDAFRLRPLHREWCINGRSTWTLLLLGGGCGFPFVQERLEKTPPLNMNVAEHSEVASLSAPAYLDVVLPTGEILPTNSASRWDRSRDAVVVNGHLLTLAYGLSFRAPDIPKFGTEPPMQPPPLPRPWEPPPHTVHT